MTESIDIGIDVGNRFESVEKSVGQLLDAVDENGWRARCEEFRTALRATGAVTYGQTASKRSR